MFRKNGHVFAGGEGQCIGCYTPNWGDSRWAYPDYELPCSRPLSSYQALLVMNCWTDRFYADGYLVTLLLRYIRLRRFKFGTHERFRSFLETVGRDRCEKIKTRANRKGGGVFTPSPSTWESHLTWKFRDDGDYHLVKRRSGHPRIWKKGRTKCYSIGGVAIMSKGMPRDNAALPLSYHFGIGCGFGNGRVIFTSAVGRVGNMSWRAMATWVPIPPLT